MLLVKTVAGPSTTAGTGLFAAEDIPADTLVWKFDSAVDSAAPLTPETSFFYSYISKQSGLVITPGDDARHINHSLTPNTGTRYEEGVEDDINFALRDIPKGEEITINYNGFAKEGVDFE